MSRIVLSPGWHRPRLARPVGRGVEHRGDRRGVEDRGVAGAESGFDAGRAVQRSRCATDRGHQAVTDGSEDLAGRRLGRQIREQLVDGPEPDDEVVAVVAVAEDRVESGQLALVPSDDPAATRETGAQRGGIDRRT